jgi:CHAT domain-containing protein
MLGVGGKPLAKSLRDVCAKLLDPVEKILPAQTKTVIISPDAGLSFVSFATLLMNDDRFLGERYSVRYVSSGRDLLSEVQKPADNHFVFFGNPDFRADDKSPKGDAPIAQVVTLRGTERSDLQGLVFRRLPGTERECQMLTVNRAGPFIVTSLGPQP